MNDPHPIIGERQPPDDYGAAPVNAHSPQNTDTATNAAAQAGLRLAITAACGLHIPEADAHERFAELKTHLSSRAARRMSRLGLMLSHLIGQTGVSEDTVVIYASAFGEVRTLENYLASFPHASPLGFQSSIHPGGVEQALIFRQQPVREFFPVTASENLPLALLRTVGQCRHAARILLLGGEEAGNWLRHHDLATDSNFAFALLLEPQRQHRTVLGWLRSDAVPAGDPAESVKTATIPAVRNTNPPTNSPKPAESAESATGPASNTNDSAESAETAGNRPVARTLLDLTTAIEARREIDFGHPDEGHWTMTWLHPD